MNALRSLPFIILLIAVIPLTKLLVGTSIGTWAAIVPLTIYIGPYMGRLIETSLLEVNEGIVACRCHNWYRGSRPHSGGRARGGCHS